MEELKNLLQDFKVEDKFKYVTKEFQDFGYRIAAQLNDLDHKSLYFKLAKTEDRNMLEEAFAFAKHYNSAKNKGKIFMWKLKELRAERKAKQREIDKKLANTQSKLLE